MVKGWQALQYNHLVEQSSPHRPSPSAIPSHMARIFPHLKAIAHEIPPPPQKKKTRQLRSTSYFVEMHGAFKSQGVQKWPERSPPGLGDWSSAGPSVVRCALPSPVVLHTSSLTSPACPLLRRKHRRLGEEFTS